MSATAFDPRLQPKRAAPKKALRLSWSDPTFRNIVWQILIIGAVVAIGYYLVHNTRQNLATRNIATGFDFLGNAAHIPIGESIIPYDSATDTWTRALTEGILNTLRVAIIGVVTATILGTLIGIGRLSKNWLVSRFCAVYVEVLRDIPVLLQLLFWYTILNGMFQTFPPPRQAMNLANLAFVSNKGMRISLLEWEAAHTWAVAAFIVAILGSIAWNRVAKKRQDETGVKPRVWPVTIVLLVGLPALAWAALGAPFTMEVPKLRGLNLSGGATVSPEFLALQIGLVIYTAAYIAEIVRSGIQAIAQGQWEAAGALGLRPGSVLRLVVLPQALRVIIPPMTSQFLNLTKNSSLALAVGFQDVVSIANTMMNQTGQAIEGVAVIMAVYLSISLSISLFMNWYNAHIALVGR